MNHRLLACIVTIALGGAGARAQSNDLSSVAIAATALQPPAGSVTVIPRIGPDAVGPDGLSNNNVYVQNSPVAGIAYVAGNLGLNGGPTSIALYALTGAAIPSGGAGADSFVGYGTIVGTPTPITTYAAAGIPADLAMYGLGGNSYSGLVFVVTADLGFGPNEFYMIHHVGSTDYFANIIPGSGTATSVGDLKPMSWPGGPAGGPGDTQAGKSGYFGMAYASSVPSHSGNWMFYLRTAGAGDSFAPAGHTVFGYMIPALTSGSTDLIDLNVASGSFGAGGYALANGNPLAFSASAMGNEPANEFYYLRQDSATGYTILGMLDPTPGNRAVSDIANLGGVYTALTFAAAETGTASGVDGEQWGSNQLYVAGKQAAGGQSVSFAAIADHSVGDVFAVTPTASSGLDLAVSVVSGPATVATTGVTGQAPSQLAYMVTTTGPGIVTLKALQVGHVGPQTYTANWLQQSFDVTGAPAITSALTAPGTVGAPLSYSITATGLPSGYSASPLPAGLSVNTATGVISGTPTAVGTTTVVLGAVNASGSSISTGTATLTITVSAAGTVPVIISPLSAAGTIGTVLSYTIAATGLPTGYSASPLPAGLAVNSGTGVISGSPTAAGATVVTIGATNGTGTGTASVAFTVAPANVAPVIAISTPAVATVAGGVFGYTIAATDSPASYGASPLPPGLNIVAATGVISGTPTTPGTTVVTLSATNGIGTGTSILTIYVAPPSRIVNFSGRALSGSGGQLQILGFAVSGGAKALLLRGIGPTLTTFFGLPGALDDPLLTLYNSIGTPLAMNNGWQNPSGAQPASATVAATAALVGAFALPGGSRDSDIQVTVSPGGYTSVLTSTDGTSGIALLELYDADGSSNPGSRIINVSDRMNVAPGNGLLIAGFVISGTGSKTVLIRGVGPGLASLGLAGALPDPRIALVSGSTVLATNSNWATGSSSAAQISAMDTQVGAFALASGSADAALLVTLQPGQYSVEVTSAGGSSGVVLLEVYDTQ